MQHSQWRAQRTTWHTPAIMQHLHCLSQLTMQCIHLLMQCTQRPWLSPHIMHIMQLPYLSQHTMQLMHQSWDIMRLMQWLSLLIMQCTTLMQR